MASEHPLFVAPPNRDTPIWRYLDFPKFVDLLFSQELHFARADMLGDPFEGSLSKVNLALRPVIYKEIADKAPDVYKRMEGLYGLTRQMMFVNCWHLGPSESFAMWKVYTRSDESLAIQSTFAALHECLPQWSYLGLVNYADYDEKFIPENNLFAPVLHKRHYFEYEKEARAIISFDRNYKNELGWKLTPDNTAIRVKVDLPRLLKGIYISPAAQPWFKEVVNALLGKLGYQISVHHSRLNDQPAF